jgi:hypothetical protein
VFRKMNNTENLFATPGFAMMFFVMAGKGRMGGDAAGRVQKDE